MIEDPPLLKVKKTRRRPTAAQISAFQNEPTGQIVDARGGRGALNMVISQQTTLPASGSSIAGPALTAENASADVLASFAAIHYAEAGDILVAGFSGNQSCAGAGDRFGRRVWRCEAPACRRCASLSLGGEVGRLQ